MGKTTVWTHWRLHGPAKSPCNNPASAYPPPPAHALTCTTATELASSLRTYMPAYICDSWALYRYRAVVTGKVELEGGTIDTPILDKASLTSFTVIEHAYQPHLEAWTTVLDLFPATGRQHQLRRHLAGIGHPIVGESRYHREATVPQDRIFEGWLGKGLFLWALELSFAHPVDGTELRFGIDPPEKFGQPVGRMKKRRRRPPSYGNAG